MNDKEISKIMGSLKISFFKAATNIIEKKKVYREVATSINNIIVANYRVKVVEINIRRIFILVLV